MFTASRFSLLIFAFLSATAGAATIIEYRDRDQFADDSGPLFVEGFNGFTETTYFNNDPLTTGGLILSVAPLFPVFNDPFNSIQVAPRDSPTWGFDGTNIVRVGLNERKTFTLGFTNPVYSFGAYFGSWNEGQVRARLEILGEVFTAPVTGQPEVRFFGYVSDAPFSSITIRGLTNEGLFLDDVAFSRTPVPEPTPFVLLVIAAAALVGGRRRRSK